MPLPCFLQPFLPHMGIFFDNLLLFWLYLRTVLSNVLFQIFYCLKTSMYSFYQTYCSKLFIAWKLQCTVSIKGNVPNYFLLKNFNILFLSKVLSQISFCLKLQCTVIMYYVLFLLNLLSHKYYLNVRVYRVHTFTDQYRKALFFCTIMETFC